MTDLTRLNAADLAARLASGDVSSVEAVPEPDEPDEMWAVSRG